ncbi:sugar phosphate isomerase/epimerase family protein [Thermofilum pendens]|uniref:Xylose isomerase domain protein TIM barrel n=1 Tax=Thermofilum pendens (strain DSM 2475 / Hrk 5) TaxID=368408 RepID=A1RYE1_THEPD|nr:sugar phosphate isomerase/epimerase family protein [Thermofilum pendens]ABL78221.1 Xylose isomerase domain protein TIM barrel [Thermofilum pendens Hrk 5]
MPARLFKLSMVIANPKARFDAVARLDPSTAVKALSELGYDGVEISVLEPVEVGELALLAREHSLEVPAVGTGLNYIHYGLSLTSPDAGVRERARRRIEEIVFEASRREIKGVIVGLIRGRGDEWGDVEGARRLLVEELRGLARKAGEQGVSLFLEPLNRYESRLVNTVEEGLRVLEEVGEDNLLLLLDTFHMNIEERVIEDSIRLASGRIGHFHVADSNRLAPGMGHLDFVRILHALRDAGYSGFVSAEIQVKPDFEAAARITMNTLSTAISVVSQLS